MTAAERDMLLSLADRWEARANECAFNIEASRGHRGMIISKWMNQAEMGACRAHSRRLRDLVHDLGDES